MFAVSAGSLLDFKRTRTLTDSSYVCMASPSSSDGVRIDVHGSADDVRLQGVLKKLKTMKKKYFILHSGSDSSPATLEYYDNEKKYRAEQPPKRSIVLKNCFNINKKCDTKHKHAIGLYTKEDCFAIVTESMEDQEMWLLALLELQGSSEEDGTPRSQFEHIWQVTVKHKGLGSSRSLGGQYRLCLTNKTLNLIRMNSDVADLTFQLASIRRCGHSDCFFFMEVGRSAVTGTGELWMQVEDSIIAQNMHEAILSSMKTSNAEDSMSRPRVSSSASDKGKPISYQGKSCAGSRKRTNSDSQGRKTKTSPKINKTTKLPSTVPVSTDHSPVSNSPLTTSMLADQYLHDYRTRSGSTDSKGTSSSMSMDDCDSGSDHKSSYGARSITPESQIHICGSLRPGEQVDNYLSMSAFNPGSGHAVNVESDMQGTGTSDGYMSMTPSSLSSSPSRSVTMGMDRSDSSSYLDMTPLAHTLPTVQENKPAPEGYMEMIPGKSPHGTIARPSTVQSYLSGEGYEEFPKRAYSVGSKPVRGSIQSPSHMDVVAKQGKLENCMSNSAPHLLPELLRVHGSPLTVRKSMKPDEGQCMMEMNFTRPRTSSDCYNLRPRTSSCGATNRPRSSSHGNKKSSSQEKLKKSNESLKSQDSLSSFKSQNGEYMEMNAALGSRRSSAHDQIQPHSEASDYMTMNPLLPKNSSSKQKTKIDKKCSVKTGSNSTLSVPKVTAPSESPRSGSPSSTGSQSPVVVTDLHASNPDIVPTGEKKLDSYMILTPGGGSTVSSSKKATKNHHNTHHDHHHHGHNHHHHHPHHHRQKSSDNTSPTVGDIRPVTAVTKSVSPGGAAHGYHSDSYMLFQPGSKIESSDSSSDSYMSLNPALDGQKKLDIFELEVARPAASPSDNHRSSLASDSYLMFSPHEITAQRPTPSVLDKKPDSGVETDSYLMFAPAKPKPAVSTLVQPVTVTMPQVVSYIRAEETSMASTPTKSLDKVLIQSASSSNLDRKANVARDVLLEPRDRHSMSDISDSSARLLASNKPHLSKYGLQPQLNYASLDLKSADEISSSLGGGSCSSVGRHSSTGSDTGEGLQHPSQPLSYAEIDFIKSEGLRTSPGRGLKENRFSFEKIVKN